MKKLLPFILFAAQTIISFSQTTYTVNTTDDLPDININDAVCADANGNCTLRAAIQNANKASNKDIIAFNISGTAPFTIVMATSGPPDIEYPIVIDGRTQTEYATLNSPVIEIDGSGLPVGNSGLTLNADADNSEIYGLSIGGFQLSEGYGIDVSSQNNIFKSNYIGLKPDGTTFNRNYWGVYFRDSGNNLFGGTAPSEGNVVSGSYKSGVTFEGVGSTNNNVQANLLGTDATGLLPRGNLFNLELKEAPNNLIGGNTPEARNIISGGINANGAVNGIGIYLNGVNATNNNIIGNYIGTDITGTVALPNKNMGISIRLGASNNNIGGEGAGEGNVISGNGSFGGIYIQGLASRIVESNVIKGNYIGVDATGNVPLPNEIGIALRENSNNTIIGGTTSNSRNVISGNTNDGIYAGNGQNIQIIGNYIGTNATGTSAVANNYGVNVSGGTLNIGGQTVGSRNIISGNNIGIRVVPTSLVTCTVLGNFIGLNASGNGAIPNVNGVYLASSSNNIVIGGSNASDGNIISGNSNMGLDVSGTSHTIQNNYIGINPDGTGVIKNGILGLQLQGVLTNTLVSENIISGNGTVSSSGRNITLFQADGVRLFSNKIGTLPDGITGVMNVGAGISMNNSSNNTIGGDSEIKGNIIGNQSGDAIVLSSGSSGNIISHNKIGLGADETTNLGNSQAGIFFSGTSLGNTITNNIIANNQNGVQLYPTTGFATQVTISQNSIYNNSLLGIDLVGTTANDVDDADTGVNNLQNTPEISLINSVGGTAIEITYEVPSSVANSVYPLTIEFFGAVNGQGKFFIESDTYAVPGSKTMTLNLPTGFDPNDYLNIVATATDANGNTSEFGITTDVPLSVKQFETVDFKLYPNPASERLFIKSPNSENYNLRIVNALGQLILVQNDNNSSIELDVSILSEGLYFMNITSKDGSRKTTKFIKN